MTKEIDVLLGFKIRDAHSVKVPGKIGVILEFFPRRTPLPGQSSEATARAASVSFLLDEKIALDLVASIQDILPKARNRSPLKSKQ